MEPLDVLAHLKRVSTFRDLEEEGEQELLRLVPHVDQVVYEPGAVLVHEHLPPDRTLILLEGHAVLTRQRVDDPEENEELGEKGPGATLGRTGLEVGAFEMATATALTMIEALVLPFRDLVRVYQQSTYLREHLPGPLKPEKLVSTLQGIPLFGQLTDRAGIIELYSLAQIAHEQVYGNGEWLFRQGEIADRLYLVIGGRVQLTGVDQDGIVRDLGALIPGDSAGETGLFVGDFHDVTATADGYARVITLLSEEFADLMAARPYLRRKLVISDTIQRRLALRTFDWVRDDEWAIAVVQRHWTRLVRQTGVLVAVLALVIPAIIWLAANGGTLSIVAAALLSLPVLALCAGIAWQYINWRDDFFVMTTQRVVHIERVGPFSTQQEESALDNIEDIYESQPNLSANVMGYGNLILQTAGETVDIDMSYIPDPDGMRRLISRQIERSRAREVLRTRGQIRDMLARRLTVGETLPPPEERAGKDADRQSGTTSLPVALATSVWEYFFPSSWVETEGGTVIWRRYWLPGMLHTIIPTLIFAATTVAGVVLLAGMWGAENFLGWTVGWLVLEAVALGVLLWFVEDWRNDFFQLTQSQIILVERRPMLLQESRHEARLDRIQNLGFEVPNVFARMMNYGHVQFETAGTEGMFELKYVRRPEAIQATISNRQYAYRQHLRQVEANRRQQEMLTWFATYDDLHRDTGS